MNGVGINTRAYVATRLLLRWDYLYAVTLKTKVFGDYNHARLEVSWITSTRGLLLRGYTGILFQTNDVRLRGGGSKLVRLEEKSAFLVLHNFPVVWVTKKSIILQTSPTGRSLCSSLSLSTSSAEQTRKLHDLAPSVMRRTNVGRPAPTPLKKKHTESPSVEPETSRLP